MIAQSLPSGCPRSNSPPFVYPLLVLALFPAYLGEQLDESHGLFKETPNLHKVTEPLFASVKTKGVLLFDKVCRLGTLRPRAIGNPRDVLWNIALPPTP
jgi:hypothetical protein